MRVQSRTMASHTQPAAPFFMATVVINSPTNGSTVAGTISFSGTAADNVAVAKVEINIDSGSWITASGTTSWSYSLNTVNVLNGMHLLSARATDTSGNISSIPASTVRFFNVPGNYLQRISAVVSARALQHGLRWLQLSL